MVVEHSRSRWALLVIGVACSSGSEQTPPGSAPETFTISPGLPRGGSEGGASHDAGSTDALGGGDEGGAAPAPGIDAFGVAQLYPTRPGTREWTSLHWKDATYEMATGREPNDPSGLSGRRGNGSIAVSNGAMVLEGNPRFYIYPGPEAPWRNIEFTAYYQRVADEGTPWGGLVMGARSGADGHTPDGRCEAHTYYTRLRHDGRHDFEKELMHTPSTTRRQMLSSCVWPGSGGEVPRRRWIGLKYIVYNLVDGGVRLEVFRDATSGESGGDWRLLNTATDDGTWCSASDCSAHAPVSGRSNLVVTEGGVAFIRNTDIAEARYRWVTLREIVPPSELTPLAHDPSCYAAVDLDSVCDR